MNDAASAQEGHSTQDSINTKISKRWSWLRPVLSVPTPVIFIAAAAVATFLLWRSAGLDDIFTSMREVHPLKVVAILLVYAFSLLLLGFRWHALVRMVGGSPSWTSSAEVFLTSVIVNYAAPIGLAVPTRAALTVRDLHMTRGQSGAVVAFEAALDVLALAVVSVSWLVLGGSVLLQATTIDLRMLAVVAIALILIIVAAGVLGRSAAVRSRIVPAARRMILMPADRPLLALLALVLTAGFWLLQIRVMGALLDVFGVMTSSTMLLGLMGLPMLIGMLSPVPGGAGVREALMVAVARLEGVPTGPVLLAAVAYRLALFVVTPIVWSLVRLARESVNRR